MAVALLPSFGQFYRKETSMALRKNTLALSFILGWIGCASVALRRRTA